MPENPPVVQLNRVDRGGHFAPVEEPELYAGELRDFFLSVPVIRPVR